MVMLKKVTIRCVLGCSIVLIMMLQACATPPVNTTPDAIKPERSLLESAPQPFENIVEARDPDATVDINGDWRIVVEHKEGLDSARMKLTQDGDHFIGTFQGYEVSGVLDGDLLTFPAIWPARGAEVPIRITALVVEDFYLEGVMSSSDEERGVFGQK